MAISSTDRTDGPPPAVGASPSRILDLLPRFADATPTMRIGPQTCERYVRIVRGFARWLDPEDATLDDIDAAFIQAYQADLCRRELADRTVRITLSAIRAFSRWCIREGLRTDDPTLGVEWPKIPKTGPRALRLEELRHLITTLLTPLTRRGVSRWQWERNRRCIELMLYAALRLGEACRLDWGDVDLDAGVLWVRQGKGKKDRPIPIHAGLAARLSEVPRDKRRGPVIPARGGTQMSEKTMAHIFMRWLPSIGVEGVTAHRLRHTCATLMRRYGADLKDIQSLLGHESLETTEIYLGPDPERLRAAVDALPALDQIGERKPPKLEVVRKTG